MASETELERGASPLDASTRPHDNQALGTYYLSDVFNQ
jgi:hypothetical protein